MDGLNGKFSPTMHQLYFQFHLVAGCLFDAAKKGCAISLLNDMIASFCPDLCVFLPFVCARVD